MARLRTHLFAATSFILLAACSDGGHRVEGSHHHAATVAVIAAKDAIAVVQPTAGNACAGVVRFSEREGHVLIVADISGLSPNARHAVHIHEFGDASSVDGLSAGGHYNPEGHPHGGLDHDERHAGDLGNLMADGNGVCHVEISVTNCSIGGARNPILGRSLVIHAKEDDLVTQPSGNAGPRIAVGVIGVAGPGERPAAAPAK
ncbi:MAG: superoxide dismutase family protein [Planctomycetes bacterium]|nr:superoxide dismutase family protein [Planctomycetota bacterium]